MKTLRELIISQSDQIFSFLPFDPFHHTHHMYESYTPGAQQALIAQDFRLRLHLEKEWPPKGELTI